MAIAFNFSNFKIHEVIEDSHEDTWTFGEINCTGACADWATYPNTGHRCEWSACSPLDAANEETEEAAQRAWESGHCPKEATVAMTSERYGAAQFLCTEHTFTVIAEFQGDGARFEGEIKVGE